MRVVDNFLPNPVRVRREALRADFADWPGPDGQTYKRICITDVPGVQAGIEQVMGPVEMLGMAYRLNYGGELPNAAIHSDLGWGTHAAVVYLCDGEGGTAFWRHKFTAEHRIEPGDVELLLQVRDDWDDASRWEMRELVEMKFNRCVIYDSALFHSRYPFAAFGDNPQTGRLTVSAFFTPKESHASP